MVEVKIETEYIKLDQFLKYQGIVNTGGEAKSLIQEGNIKVNGNIEFARGKKLKPGDIIEFEDKKYQIV